ncbi:lantibiotic dehydratase [Nocardioides speluncae]|uniref:lantibiotic dehydratase n=1 Tax=Nocardioides speluncae TaxID=2670337 RepID=UPI00197ED9E8|nr:lantibiotic dehydratase [Nocardioides speluncae]
MSANVAAFRSGKTALLRAVARPELDLPAWPALASDTPDIAGAAVQLSWLGQVWQRTEIVEELSLASPGLARKVQALTTATNPSPRDVRRAGLSVCRYLLRAQHRATPFGLFAGVAAARFGSHARVEWGTGHQPVVAASAEWLTAVIAKIETCPEALAHVLVMTNSCLMVRGDRLIVPYQSHHPRSMDKRSAAAEVSMAYTAPLRAAVTAATAPIRLGDLEDRIRADFPDASESRVSGLLAELVSRRVLISALHAPATQTDSLAHLIEHLPPDSPDSPLPGLVGKLRSIHTAMAECSTRTGDEARQARHELVAKMHSVSEVEQHPLAVDLRLDADVVLPEEVAREAERAALALARVSAAPYGAAAWKSYHQRFYERFGIGSMVPVLDVVADSGIGYPDGYPGSTAPQRRAPLSSRDETLLRLAQKAVLDGRQEVVLDEELIESLQTGPDPVRLPPHLEVGVRVNAASIEALQQGSFGLEIVSVSRGAGVGSGRFQRVLNPTDRADMAAELANLPGADDNTVTAQLSFPPLQPNTAHVARAPQMLPLTISLEEHRGADDRTLTLDDLAVGCDGRRMYLAAPRRGHRVEAVAMHALNLRTHTPPVARLLIELSRAQCTAVTMFDWGAARTLPFLPRVRYGRSVLSPARWRLEPTDLPGTSAPQTEWDDALGQWRASRRTPQHVYLTEGDRLLALDLDQPGHRVLLREHLNNAAAVLTEASAQAGWCEGRAHEVVIPMRAVEPPPWPRLPRPTAARVIGRDQGQVPATSRVLLASLYGDIRRQDTLLARHLPDLLDELGQPPWWFVRFRDPDQHLRVRIALPDPEAFGEVAATISRWSKQLHHAGLLREVRYSTSYPETGRWGAERAWNAAEDVFGADSRALLTQLRQPATPHRRALVAAHSVAIACTFAGSVTAGMQWLIDNIPATAPEPLPREQFSQAVQAANPNDNRAALRALPGGAAIVQAWAGRDAALVHYRDLLPGADEGIDPDDVLGSLLHVHFVRAVAVDFAEEAICLYLARAAALAWTARTNGRPE